MLQLALCANKVLACQRCGAAMVRQCQAEQATSAYADGLLQQRKALEVGLLVGRLGTARDYLLFLVKTPAQDGAKPVTAKSSGAAAALRLDDEWISEHAAQVSRMLPGGVAVVGAYLLAPDKAFSAAVPQLCGLAKALRRDAADDSLLMHIDATTGKVSLKEYGGTATATAAGLKPVELRFASILQGFQPLRCSFDVELTAAVPKGGATLCNRFHNLIQQEAARIQAGVALIDGKPIDVGAPLADVLPAAVDAASPQQVQLLCPLGCAAIGSSVAKRSAVGRVRLAGRLEAFAFVPRREPAAAAVAALRDDLAASLKARIESIEEDAEAVAADQGLESHPLLSRPTQIAIVAPLLPARLFLPTQAGVPVCEYLLEADTVEDAVGRARELLGEGLLVKSAAPSAAEQGQRPAPPDAPWDPIQEQNTMEPAPQKPEGNWLTRLPVPVTFVIWILVGLAAAAAAMPISKWIVESSYLAAKP